MQKLLKQGYAVPSLVITTNILWSSSQTGRPLRNINVSNGNVD
jgi:hypothetical protein